MYCLTISLFFLIVLNLLNIFLIMSYVAKLLFSVADEFSTIWLSYSFGPLKPHIFHSEIRLMCPVLWHCNLYCDPLNHRVAPVNVFFLIQGWLSREIEKWMCEVLFILIYIYVYKSKFAWLLRKHWLIFTYRLSLWPRQGLVWL